jgi:type I restriction-modification system DNA methylase subunit/restriction endonuclease S subunit
MIIKDNLKDLLLNLGFTANGNVYDKHFVNHDCDLAVDFKKNELIYPESNGLKINERQTCNFSSSENFVVFECVHRLLSQGYKPESIELEPKWKVGHGASGGRADILVKNQQNEPLLIIECKIAGKEFDKAWKDTLEDGGQLFSYIEQEKAVEFVTLYACDFINNQIISDQRIISHKDNEKILAENTKLKAFKDAKNVKERFKVWKDTYKFEFTEKGLFEENIQAYQIGKDKYTLDIDTKLIDASDKKGKYHQFRTILRKYNVSRRENAFEVLVNLFLCKIVDETENPNDLKFYWKGIAYDNYYDLVDRLQALYQIGMSKYLKQDTVYISNDDIDSAFWTIKQKRNATRNTIKEIFRQLKFFKGLDFDFIKVHNQIQFEKNAKILLEMIQIWQGLRLLSHGQNQFLGDMFEFFLDNGIKQSEGQFFTPVPICKFIVASLPLEQKIINSREPVKAIDYACGSGHFLNEFALAITPLVEKHKQTDIKNYYQNIIGIEKEDRLAKVAKVSAFMYGQEEINIIEQDALDQNEQIKPNSFDCLVANPPFAVEDFLLTLDEELRETYSLFDTVNDLGNKNIQCFFLEKAKQLLAPNGVTGIIVPSSILNNADNTHIRTREILLKHFDIVSIVELGSGTFGKTGTNTVVLFMRRKAHNPSQAEHFANRINDFFENWEEESQTGGGAYKDVAVIEAYCDQQEIDFDHYKSLLKCEYSEELFDCEIFEEYEKTFNNLTVTNNLKKAKQFKAKPQNEQVLELEKRLLEWVITIEKDKLYYFMLAYNNPQKVLIVKSPSEKKAIKEFLGYEWSGAKGSEGIRYVHGDTVYDIQTPLYNPNDINDINKINSLISNNFNNNDVTIPEHLKPYVSLVSLNDMLDFSRVEFNKEFSLNATQKIEIESKYNRVKVGELLSLKYGKALPESERIVGEFPVYGSNGIIGYHDSYIVEAPCIIVGRKGSAGELNWSNLNCTPIDTAFYVSIIDETKISLKYAYEILKKLDLPSTKGGSGSGGINKNDIHAMRVPLPPMNIQNQIVAECEAVYQEVEQARSTLEYAQNQIEQLVTASFSTNQKLGNVFSQITEKVDPTKKSGLINYIGLENIESNTGNLVNFSESEYQEIKSAKTKFSIGDLLYGKLRPNLNKVYWAEFDGICSTDILVFSIDNVSLAKFYCHYLLCQQFNDEVLKSVSGQQLPRTSYKKMEQIVIPVPQGQELTDVIKKIKLIEIQIANAEKVIAGSAERKEAILNNHLK